MQLQRVVYKLDRVYRSSIKAALHITESQDRPRLWSRATALHLEGEGQNFFRG